MQPKAIIGKNFVKELLPIIQSAKQSINIIVYDWRFYQNDVASPCSQFNLAIARASARGVRVKVLVQHEATITLLRQQGCDAKRLQTTRLLHTKMMIIDNVKIVLGSHNYTQSAFTVNEEVSVCFDAGSEQNDFLAYFNALWGV